MGKAWQDQQRCGAQALSGRITVIPKENFTAPKSGLEKLTFSQGTTRDAARFKDTLDKMAQHIITWYGYGAANTAKAMIDMAEPVFLQPVCPPNNIY